METSRRGFLRGALAGGAAVGLAALGVFPRAREALAHHSNSHYGYRIWTGACPSYAAGHNCEPGCGPSTIYVDACEPSGAYEGWHKASSGYRLRPGACRSGYDGWTWRYGARCGQCSNVIEYRCHDGYKLIGGGYHNSICREVTECDGRDPDEPLVHHPIGEVTLMAAVAPGEIRIRGWAIDPDDTGGKVLIRVKRGAGVLAEQRADRPNWRVPPLFQQFGRRHSFDIRIRNQSPGRQTLRVYAVNTFGPGRTERLALQEISVPQPANQGSE